MNLDFFNDFSRNFHEGNYALKFIDELTNYLGNARKNILENQNLSDFMNINNLISKYKISYDSLEDFYEKSSDILKSYSKTIDNENSVYYVSSNNDLHDKYNINNIYEINEYKNGEKLEKIHLTGSNLPNNIQTGIILKKDGNIYEIDFLGSKRVSKQLEKIAQEIANLQESKLQKYRKENNLYVVVKKNLHSAYLKDTNTNIIFEEVNFSDDTFGLLCNDAVVKFKNGKYIYEDELTRKNMYSINSY